MTPERTNDPLEEAFSEYTKKFPKPEGAARQVLKDYLDLLDAQIQHNDDPDKSVEKLTTIQNHIKDQIRTREGSQGQYSKDYMTIHEIFGPIRKTRNMKLWRGFHSRLQEILQNPPQKNGEDEAIN